jgi:putative phosphoesterase
MLIALAADIHANLPACDAFLEDARNCSVDVLAIAGDFAGYYPETEQVVDRIRALEARVIAVRGNHDEIAARRGTDDGRMASDDRERPRLSAANAAYLGSLPDAEHFVVDGRVVHLFHGTPDDPLLGRLYPDQSLPDSAFPVDADLIVLGHTHYPAVWHGRKSSLIVNPGSVGQPRDGCPMPSWALYDTANGCVCFRRSLYDRDRYVSQLRSMQWDEDAIRSLLKDKPGPRRRQG